MNLDKFKIKIMLGNCTNKQLYNFAHDIRHCLKVCPSRLSELNKTELKKYFELLALFAETHACQNTSYFIMKKERDDALKILLKGHKEVSKKFDIAVKEMYRKK